MAPPRVRESAPGYLFVLSSLSLAEVLYMGYASFVVLKMVCVLCLITYAAVIGLFVISGAATIFPMTTLPTRAARDLRLLVASPIAIAVLLLAGAGTTFAFFPRATPQGAVAAPPVQGQQTELERFMAAAPRVPLLIPAEGAKVLIVEFHDYQCPSCGQAYLSYKPILAKYEAEYPGAVKLVLKDFPLSSACNPDVRTVMHPAACDAAVAVRLARLHNRADALEDWLFTNQASLTPAVVRQAARDVGGVTDFDAKYASTLELVKGDAALGHQLHIAQTPTFFIDGVKIEGVWAPQFFEQAIAYELRRAGVK